MSFDDLRREREERERRERIERERLIKEKPIRKQEARDLRRERKILKRQHEEAKIMVYSLIRQLSIAVGINFRTKELYNCVIEVKTDKGTRLIRIDADGAIAIGHFNTGSSNLSSHFPPVPYNEWRNNPHVLEEKLVEEYQYPHGWNQSGDDGG